LSMIGAVATGGNSENLTVDAYNDDLKSRIFDIGALSQRLIANVKVTMVTKTASQVRVELPDLPQTKSFQSKGCHSSV
jgi:hypothetical protein